MVSCLLQCIFLLFCVACANSESLETDAFASLESEQMTAEGIAKILDVMQSINGTLRDDIYRIFMGNTLLSHEKLLTKYNRLSLDFDYLDPSILSDVRKLENFQIAKFHFRNLVEEIDINFELYMKIANSLSTTTEKEIIDMINKLHSTNDTKLEKYIHDMFIMEDYEFSYDFESEKQLELQNNYSEGRGPSQQFIIYDFYLTVVSSHLKSLAVDIFLHHYNYTSLDGMTLEQLRAKNAERLELAKTALERDYLFILQFMPTTSKLIQNSLPKNLKRDETFIEFEKVFQLMVSPNHGYWARDSCLSSCYSMHREMEGKELCYDGYCSSCNGEIKNCQSGPTIAHCDPRDSKSTRRHEWIETFNKKPCQSSDLSSSSTNLNQRYGTVSYPTESGNCNAAKLNCPGNDYRVEQDYFRGFLRFGTRCEFCVCTCEENKHYSKSSTFLISSRLVEADVENNMVITGVKFKKHDKIVYVQIKQGKLSAGGFIEPMTESWKKIEPLDRAKVNRVIEKNAYSTIKNIFKDFIVISDNAKYFNLDDLKCRSKYFVVTGISLNIMKLDNIQDSIGLRIKCQHFDFNQGQFLDATEIIEKKNYHTMKRVHGLMPPDRVHDQKYEGSRPFMDNEFVEISMSDKYSDAGQSVVPWLDAQEIESTTSVPLSGIGIYHASSKESAGFIAYRLHSMDYSQLLSF